MNQLDRAKNGRPPDFVLDTSLGEEGLHAVPRRVFYAHQSEYTLEYVPHRCRGSSQRTNFSQRVGTYTSHRLSSLRHQRLDFP